jgi:hypothetical protein
MKFFKKNILFIFLLAGIFSAESSFAQETKKHKRMWWRFKMKKHPDAFNPSVSHGKATHEESRKQKREDARAVKRAKKEYKKGIKRSARKRKKGK